MSGTANYGSSAKWRIRANGLGKKFSRSLGQALRYGFADALRRLLGLRVSGEALRSGEFWALQNVSFELQAGECLAIMGANGSGKTTLLRLLKGIYAPDAGQVMLRGRVGALIAAGAGFSPVLTGRENIFVNAALLGLSRQETRTRLDEIVAFAGVCDFLDAPVKHYSSGMQVRLGFAIAAVARPEVLLVDEVLAVGDFSFQKKCFEHLHSLKREGTAILLVSHAVSAVWALCDRGLLLDRGKMAVCGPVEDVIRAYKDATAEHAVAVKPNGSVGGTGDAVVHHTRCLSDTGEARAEFAFGAPIILESLVEIRDTLRQPIFRYTLDAEQARFVVCLDSEEQQLRLEEIKPGVYRWRTTIPRQNLMPGAYTVNLAICRREQGVHLFFQLAACRFRIMQPADKFFYGDDNAVVYLHSQFAVEEMAIDWQAAPQCATEVS